MIYPKEFPSAFTHRILELVRSNPDYEQEFQRVISSPYLKKFWPWAEKHIEAHHATGELSGPLELWKSSFAKTLLLYILPNDHFNKETLATRKARRHTDIPKAARELARLLQHDPDLLTLLEYRQMTAINRTGRPGCKYALGFPGMLDELAKFAKETEFEPHPYEPSNPGAKNASINRRGRAILDLMTTYTGGKHWEWIGVLIAVADNKDPDDSAYANIRQRVEKSI
jgi:hypothetical protein